MMVRAVINALFLLGQGKTPTLTSLDRARKIEKIKLQLERLGSLTESSHAGK